MTTSVVYLENYVESTVGLPPELQRLLKTIQDLDERAQVLTVQIQDNVDECLNMPCQAARKPVSGTQNEVADLRKKIEDEQRMLMQWSEERLALAQSLLGLLELHVTQANKDIIAFDSELQAQSANMDGGMLDLYPTPADLRKQQVADIQAKRQEKEARRRQKELEQVERQNAAATAAGPGPQATPHFAVPSARPHSARSARFAEGAAVPNGQSEGHLSHAQKRRSPHTSPRGMLAGAGVGQGQAHTEPHDMPMPHWAPPGMSHAGSAPQAGGRLLTYHDITPDLQGRRAELYWPDDNLWYLISIEHVDLLTQKASIMYSTGETEELNLNDIVKEGHMSLIPDR
ncbi:hypothetical protein ABBQ38_003304 [Trebouxia sp. C0009 RCD-2024]